MITLAVSMMFGVSLAVITICAFCAPHGEEIPGVGFVYDDPDTWGDQ